MIIEWNIAQLIIYANYIFFFFIFFSFCHNKIHAVTNCKAIKNKIYKTRQHKKFFLTNKTATRTTKHAHTHTNTKKKKEKKRKWDEITCSRPPAFSFQTEYQSIIWSIGQHFFNNLSLLELVNSFSVSLIFLIVIIKLLKFNCLVFLVL